MPVCLSRHRPVVDAPGPTTGRSLLPVGITTILPETARRVRQLEDVLLAMLGRWGYHEIILPTFEYLDVLSPGLQSRAIEKGYQLTDRTTGRTLVLRPDATAQIARTVAMGMLGERFPLRLAYRTTVFRYEPEHLGRDRELLQVGAELIGLSDMEADTEIIALMSECLRRIGIKSFKISLGHAGFLQGLLRRAGMGPAARKEAEQAAARKDIPKLEELLDKERVASRRGKAVIEALGLYGREEILERGRALAGRDQLVCAALDRLGSVYRALEESGFREHLYLDLGELRGLDYYDGIIFDVFAEGVGYELGGGGRYDHLLGRFGRMSPSTGFAFDVDRLFQVSERVEINTTAPETVALVVAPRSRASSMRRVAQLLRTRGICAILGTPLGTGSRSIGHAFDEARRLHVTSLIFLGVPPAGAEQGILVEAGSLPSRIAGTPAAVLTATGARVLSVEALADVLAKAAR
ncbi:MAG: ATP phosphoribosyltransferase regulatory subunit [Nitrospiraceae bacterium]